MKIQLLPGTVDENGKASLRQHFCCIVIDDIAAIDAGSLAQSVNSVQRNSIRDVVLSHAHLDHIAGLPLFVDDLFAFLETPIRVHAHQSVIDVLERDIFNGSVYPRFSELENEHGKVLEYVPFDSDLPFSLSHLDILPVSVNHNVPSFGFFVSGDDDVSVALTGDTASMDNFWVEANARDLNALFIECAFPNSMRKLASVSHHLTPDQLGNELEKFSDKACPIFVINIKPSFRDEVVREVESLGLANLEVLEVGRVYEI